MSPAPSDPKYGYLNIPVLYYDIQDSTGKPQLTQKKCLIKMFHYKPVFGT